MLWPSFLFQGHKSSFSVVLETKKSITLEDVPVVSNLSKKGQKMFVVAFYVDK